MIYTYIRQKCYAHCIELHMKMIFSKRFTSQIKLKNYLDRLSWNSHTVITFFITSIFVFCRDYKINVIILINNLIDISVNDIDINVNLYIYMNIFIINFCCTDILLSSQKNSDLIIITDANLLNDAFKKP